MEAAKINWESLESVFILDQIYENINAPQWVDFLASDHPSPLSGQDESWFCRPDCKHPKTAEDFLKSNPNSKVLRSVSVSKLIGIGDWTSRQENQKKQGSVLDQSNAETENENPNFSTPNSQIKPFKSKMNSIAQKSSEELEEDDADEYSEIVLRIEEKSKPKLRSTQSARDLFGGKDIFNKISEFCNELKKMTSFSKEKEAEKLGVGSGSSDRNLLETKKNEIAKERKPFLEVSKERSISKKKLIRKKKILDNDEEENIPVSLNLNLMHIKRKDEERCLLPIRTNPPTPQGFSEKRDPIKISPSKGPTSRLMEREILVGKNRTLKEELSDTKNRGGLDVFWFLKPCTLSSSSSV